MAAAVAGSVSALLVWIAPPGADLAAHVYQRTLFLQHGLTFWNNFWYAGRYSFVTYSVLYYPLAALLGINALAISTIAAASFAFSTIALRQWGSAALWSSRAFSVVWGGVVLLAMFPFALGAAFALLALWAVQARRLRRMAVLSLLSLAASPVAFVLLVVVLAAIAVGRRADRRFLIAAGLVLGTLSLAELVLLRLFPSSGRYPFPVGEMAAALASCAVGTALTWRSERARAIRYLFPAYAAACIAAYAVPSALGENIDRLRYLAVPLALLVLALRNWRPRAVSVVALVLAALWNVTPLVTGFALAQSDPAARVSYWAPAIQYLKAHLSPDYRVEAVDTADHWEAVYLPQAGIPLTRGWFRQDDYPENAVLYSRLGPHAYTAWLHRLGVGYVVLTGAPPDYSAQAEEKLIKDGRLPLRLVLATTNIRIYSVRSPRPLITGPGHPHVVDLANSSITVTLTRPGAYRIAVNSSPYWHASSGCLDQGRDGMIRLHANAAGRIRLTFVFSATAALDTLAGTTTASCAPNGPAPRAG